MVKEIAHKLFGELELWLSGHSACCTLKCENFSLEAQKKPGVVAHFWNPSAGDRNRPISGACWIARLAEAASPRLSEMEVGRGEKRERVQLGSDRPKENDHLTPRPEIPSIFLPTSSSHHL